MSLLLKKADLEREVALVLGWGPGVDAGAEEWSDEQKLLLKGFIDSGYSRFINTPPLPNGEHRGGHDWSFLKPKMRLLVPSGADRISLPDDFAGFVGPLTIESDTSSSLPVRIGNDSMLYMERQRAAGRVGRPLLAVIRPRKQALMKFDVDLWPTADQEYTLAGIYNISPEALTEQNPVAYGGIIHRETLLESCLAVAEERWDKIPLGPHYQAFMRCLAASIRKDRDMRPIFYGYDQDKSDQMHAQWRDFPPIKINGVVPA